MGWFSDAFDSVKGVVRDVYDWTSDSSSSFGSVMSYAYPFNAPYLARDAWRDVKDEFFGAVDGGSSGSGVFNVNSAGSLYGYTGSIRGRY